MDKQSIWAWFEKFSTGIVSIDLQCCYYGHFVFVRHTTFDVVPFAVFVDEILLTESDITILTEIKDYLKQLFVTKAMGRQISFWIG